MLDAVYTLEILEKKIMISFGNFQKNHAKFEKKNTKVSSSPNIYCHY